MPIPYAESVSRWSRFVWALFLLAIPAAVYGGQAVGIQIPPPQTKVYLRSQRTNYFLGENVILEYAVQNIGDKVLKFTVDSSRGFKVTGTDENGNLLPTFDPYGNVTGGSFLGSFCYVRPGETAYIPFEPLLYLQIETPGTYTVRAHPGLDWDEDVDGPWPGDSEIKLTFAVPTDEQALDLAARFTEVKDIDYAMYGMQPTTIELPPDPSICNRFSFATLNKLAAAGNTGAIGCIGMTETYAATESLVNLITADLTRIPDAATRMLALRVPDPEFANREPGPRRNAPFRDPGKDWRKALSAKTWKPAFAPRLYAAALVMLRDANAERRNMGAFYLEAIGTGDQISAVFDALDEPVRANPPTGEYAGFLLPKGNVVQLPRPPGAEQLFRAADALVAGGAPAPENLDRPAVLAFHLRRMIYDFAYRLPNWQALAPSWVEHELPFIRLLALEFLSLAPEPVPDSCVRLLAARLEEHDENIKDEALKVITKAKDVNSRAAVLRILDSDFVSHFSDASAAAVALGARFEFLEICARQLEESRAWIPALKSLCGLIDGPVRLDGYSLQDPGDMRAAKKVWTSFLARHRHEIAEGKKFPLKEFKPAMFPPPGGLLIGKDEHWPVRK